MPDAALSPRGPVRCYHEPDADPEALAGQRIAVVGYGNLGRPAACNLRDSGLDVVVGAGRLADTERAAADGFVVGPAEKVVEEADVVWLAVPDEAVPSLIGAGEGSLGLRPGALLCLPSGYPVAFGLVELDPALDVVLLAPRMLGERIRSLYLAGEGFVSYVSVVQDASGTAAHRLLALAHAFGTLRAGALEIDARAEAVLDLYVEQTVGPLLGAAVLNAFEAGAAAGLPPEALALELYQSGEMGATWEAFASHGFFPAVRLHGHTAAFGGFTRLGALDQEGMRRRFEETLDDIMSGAFARRLQADAEAGSPVRSLIEAMVGGDDPLSRAEASARRALAGDDGPEEITP